MTFLLGSPDPAFSVTITIHNKKTDLKQPHRTNQEEEFVDEAVKVGSVAIRKLAAM